MAFLKQKLSLVPLLFLELTLSASNEVCLRGGVAASYDGVHGLRVNERLELHSLESYSVRRFQNEVSNSSPPTATVFGNLASSVVYDPSN